MAELVGRHVAGPGAFGDRRDVAGDGAPVERLAVVSFDEPPRACRGPGGVPGGDELDELGEQWDVAVVVELADGDAQPVGAAGVDHGAGFERGEFTSAHPGPGQQLDHEPTPLVRVDSEGGHELRRGRVIEELR